MTQAPVAPQAGALVAPGEVFAGKYIIEREIGAGGMGVVLAARHQQLGQTVAIKLLAVPSAMQPEAVRRFLAEAQAAARLRSEHVARIMDAGVDEKGRHYIIMEYLQGADLGGLLRESGPLPIADAVGYVLQACEGIAEAHAHGIVHRDLKPENLFVTRRIDGSPLVKVLDFGISKMIAQDLRPQLAVTPRGALMGSPLYMSPEQLRQPSKVDARSDIWGLGVILYELLTDKIPFGGAELPAVIASVLSGPPPPVESLRPDLPPELAAVVARALAKEPDARYPNVGELARGLAPWAPPWANDCAARAIRTLRLPGAAEIGGIQTRVAFATDAPTPPPVALPDRSPAPARRKGAVLAIAVAVLAVVVVIGLTRGRRAATSGPAATSSAAPAASAVPTSSEPPSSPPSPSPPPPAAGEPTLERPAQRRPEPPTPARASKPRPKRMKPPRVDPLEGRR